MVGDRRPGQFGDTVLGGVVEDGILRDIALVSGILGVEGHREVFRKRRPSGREIYTR